MSQGVNHRDPAGPVSPGEDTGSNTGGNTGGNTGENGEPGAADARGPAVEWLVTAANPRDVDAALSWQLERVGSGAWDKWSLKFQRMAFGYSLDTGWHDEAEAWAWLESHRFLYDGLPPRGALVWYEGGTRVACSLGRGTIVGPLPGAAVAIATLEDLGGPYLWSAPLFPFAH